MFDEPAEDIESTRDRVHRGQSTKVYKSQETTHSCSSKAKASSALSTRSNAHTALCAVKLDLSRGSFLEPPTTPSRESQPLQHLFSSAMSKTARFLRHAISQPLKATRPIHLDLLQFQERKTSSWICQQCRRQSSSAIGNDGLSSRARSRPGTILDHLQRSSFARQSSPRGLSARHASSAAPSASPAPSSTAVSSNGGALGVNEQEREGREPSGGELPSQEEGRRSAVSKRFTHVMDELQSNIFIAGQRLNDLTGYSGIEALKQDIQRQETIVQTTRTALQNAKTKHASALATRSATQREVNDLLQRKADWSAHDLDRFTTLIRSDHADERAVAAAAAALLAAERDADAAAQRLAASILARYHEEQIWSDKIRRMSTWGTWGLMGVNVLLFVVLQVAVEPWRRARLVRGFEQKVAEAMERGRREGGSGNVATSAYEALIQDRGTDNVASEASSLVAATSQAEQEAHIDRLTLAKLTTEVEIASTNALAEKTESPHRSLQWTTSWETLTATTRDLFSERLVTLSQRDLTARVLESAVMGMLLASIAGVVVGRGGR